MQEDLLYVYWISHGTSSYFTTAGNSVRHSTLASWMEGIKAKQIIGVYQPCLSGAVVDDISGENIITVTSTDPTTINNWCWGENIAFALAGPPYCDQWMSPGHVVMSINIVKHEEYLQGLASDPIRYITVAGNADLKDERWHHVAGTYDGRRVCLYIDGALSNSRRVSGNIATNDSIVVIGDNPEWGYNWNWNGLIDDVRIYSYALSPEEVEMLYRGEESPLKK